MNVLNLAMSACSMKGWPCRQEMNGELRIEVPTVPGRSQVVSIVMGRDGDNDAAAFIWSAAGDTNVIRDPYAIFRLNAQLTYGRVALRGQEVVVMHALHDPTAQISDVGKCIYWVAKAADDLEQQTYGAYSDRF